MINNTERGYYRFLALLLLLSLINCDQNTIKNQIDQEDAKKTSLSQQKDSKFTTLYQAEQSLKMISSEIVQAKLGAIDMYSAFYNEDQRCKGLKVEFNRFYNESEIGVNSCLSDAPLTESLNDLFKARLQLHHLEILAQKAKRLYEDQEKYLEDREIESQINSRLKSIANSIYSNASDKYTRCMDDYATDNDTEPLECEELKNEYQRTMEIFEKFYSIEQNFLFETQEYSAELVEKKAASESAALAESQARSNITFPINQNNAIYDICIANRNNIKIVLNQRLKSALETATRYGKQRTKIEGIQAEINSLLEDTSGKTSNIESLAAALKQLF